MTDLILQTERKQVRYFVEKLGETSTRPEDLELTPREQEVWNLRQANYSSMQIATQLSITRNTVQKHLVNIRTKQNQAAEEVGVGLDMILVPGGTFLMGSPENEPERSDDEGPQHQVTVPSFFMGRYPVTQAQWQAVAGFPQVKQELDPALSNFKGENRPVEQVSWFDAVEFCARLSVHTGREYRLPSEAEWEYACRAGTTTPFYFGKTLTTEVANYDGNYTYNGGPNGEYRAETTPVDYFGIANAFGLCDMHGNVLEWCLDHWHETYKGAPTDGSAWLSNDKNSFRVRRGGSWFNNPRYCRSAFRFCNSPDGRNHTFGFRVVCSAPRTL